MAEQEYSRSLPQGQAPERAPARTSGFEGHGRRFLSSAHLALVLLLPLSACSAPDHPLRLPPDLPAPLGTTLSARKVWAVSAAQGLAYYELRVVEAPWAIHLLRVEMRRCELGLRVLPAPPTPGMTGGVSRVSELFAMSGGTTLAAVNGDFFAVEEGVTSGPEVVMGQVRRVSGRPALAWRPGRSPWMGIPDTEGDSVLLTGWRVPRSPPDGVTEVVGGFPLLLLRGERVGDLEVTARPAFAAARHPRTALGFDPSAGLLWVVVVDGRQPDYSAGMTLPELATLMESLGVTEAMNLDGGGSSVMVLRGVTVSRPSDEGGEREVANALAIEVDPGLCGPERGPDPRRSP